jgi:hypothetical protein
MRYPGDFREADYQLKEEASMTRRVTTPVLLLAITLLAGGVSAAETGDNPIAGQDAINIPRLIHYQGKLTDLGGVPITGARSMTFRLYAGVSQFWTESRTVSVSQGIFNVLLGSVNPVATIPEAEVCSLEVIVEGQPIVPKTRLVSVPFAYNANKSHDIDDDAITNPKLALNAVTTDKIMDGTIQNSDLAANAVTTDKISDGGVQTQDLASGSVTNSKLALNAVTSDRITDGDVQAADIAAGAVSNSKIALNAVTSDRILDGTILTADLALNAVTSDRILDGAVAAADLATGAVTNPKLAPDAVTTDKIADGNVQAADIAAGAVSNSKIALNAVTSDRILDGTILTADLAPNAVTSDKILDGTVQAADLATGAVTNPKLGSDAVTTDKILDGTIADLDLSASGVTPGTYNLATVTVNSKGRITAASSGSGGSGVTRVDQGTGVALSPNPITSTGSVRLDTIYSDGRYIRNQDNFAQDADFWISGAGQAVQFNAASAVTGYPAMLADGGTYSYGLAATNNHATNMAVSARNTAAAGTGIIASGNNMTPYYHVRGTGGCFTGKFAGAMGVTDDVTGFGIAGVSVNLQGTGVGGAGNNFDTVYSPTGGAGGAFRGNAAGVYGRTDSASGYGVMGFNYNTRGSAVVGLANRMSVVHQVNGGVGGSFNGRGAGAVCWSDSSAGFGVIGLTTGAAATGAVGAGNGRSMYLMPGGSGGAFTGRQYGVYAIAETTGGTRAGGVFAYNGGGNVAVALNDNGTLYKINGPGTVNTVMATREGSKSLFCPEMPEAWLEDVGAGRLVRGHCRIDLASLFTDCIATGDNAPLRVFVQLEDDCNGVYVRTDDRGFDVYELRQGTSDARFSYRVMGKWKGYESLRFPDAPKLPAGLPADKAIETRSVDAVPVNSAPEPAPNRVRK